MFDLHPDNDPSRNNAPSGFRSLGEERLRLGAAVAGLEPICRALPVLANEFLLWFRPEEIQAVNRCWEDHGIAGVVQHWGAERRLAVQPNQLPHRQRSAIQQWQPPAAPGKQEPTRLLLVTEFRHDRRPDPRQAQYFRSAWLPLDEPAEHRLLLALRSAWLFDAVVPARDPVENVEISGANVVGITSRVEWYGPKNPYGSGCVLHIGIELQPASGAPRSAFLALDERADARRYLWAPHLFETGYEGHDHRPLVFDAAQVRALIEIVRTLPHPPEKPNTPVIIGCWYGNSFLAGG